MNDLFEKIWHELQSLNPDRHIKLIKNELAPAYADKTLMRQVFYNLVSNAMKFTQNKDNAIIEVSSYSEKLFKVFQRLHSASEYQEPV